MSNDVSKKTEGNLENAKEKLYYSLKGEINDKLKRIESMSTFCITTTIAVYAFVLKDENISRWVLLLPLILIIMVSYRAANNRIDILKMSAYIEAKELEPVDLTWEKDNNDLIRTMEVKDFGLFYKVSSSWCKFPDFLLMTAICLTVFYFNFNCDELSNQELHFLWFGMIAALIIELYLFINLNLMRGKLKKERFKKKFNDNMGGQS
ncbi:MAG: hypothetical protein NC485_13455 [Ruminococcus flavefaciens]|nr:hypothetical protein [Ruminococcus flavefaciens]MCM1062543.1 hypothetical protein [Eubacterium sp.]